MKILSIGNFGHGWDGSICDEEHIAKALEGLGHKVIRWQREEVSQYYPKDEEFAFILLAQWDQYPNNWSDSDDGKKWRTTDLVEHLKHQYSCPVIYWAFDYQADGQEWHERLIKQSDLYLSKRIADSKYPNWQWLSQDFAPDFLLPTVVPEQDIDVLFTGSYLPWATERNETIKAVNERFNLVIHSVNKWPEEFRDVRLPIMDEGLPKLYARAKVILSIDHTIEAGYWSDRNAQIMVCGRTPLFRYVPMSEARFGTGVIYFYGIEDCLKNIRDMLDGKDMHTQDNQAYIIAHKNATAYRRVQDLLTIVKGIL